ncbi:MAG: SDR family NAD(P)-dependent oxidoreductase [Armatimonadetes bacterium]|nr:SDR family NAD(P)-dependent oxidoreductase [Armatimonadota bacterium]
MFRSVVTGASSGIGRATALLMAAAGHELVLISRRESILEEIAQRCESLGSPSATVVAGDVSDPETAERVKQAVGKSDDSEIVLINNAASAAFGPFHELPVEGACDMIDVGMKGGFLMTHALLPAMLDQGRGTVINVLSIAATQPIPGAAAYCAMKAGMLAFSRTLALEYRRKGVRVGSILPGSTDTAIWDGMSDHPPREDMLQPEAVAEMILQMVSAPRDRSLDEVVLTPPKGFL